VDNARVELYIAV